MSVDTIDLGSSGLEESGTVWATCKGAEIAENEAPDFGRVPVSYGVGFASRPYRADERGFAQGFVVEAPGYDGVLIGGHDSRCAKTYGNLAEGATTMFATGKDFDSRVILGDRIASIVVDDDVIVQLDGRRKEIRVNTPGGTFKSGKADGLVLADGTGKSIVQLKDGVTLIGGKTVLGGRNPYDAPASNTKVMIELAKIAATFAALSSPPPSPYVPSPLGVGTPGVSIGK